MQRRSIRSRKPDESRQILIAVATGFIVLMLIVGILAALVPYEVDLRSDIDQAEGEIQLQDRFGHEDKLLEEMPLGLLPGDAVNVEEGGRLQIELIDNSKAYVYLTGPVHWKLVTAWRSGTMTEHMREAAEAFRVIVEQSGAGTVIYDLSNAEPTLDEMNLLLLLPDGEFEPITPCFQVTAPGDGTPSAVVDIACPSGEITPLPEPTLPSLP